MTFCNIKELVELNKQTINTQAKKAEELIANQVFYVEAIKMMGDDIFDLGIENEALRRKLGEVDEKWLSKSKNRIKVSYNDARKNKFILERMERQTQKIKAILALLGQKIVIIYATTHLKSSHKSSLNAFKPLIDHPFQFMSGVI